MAIAAFVLTAFVLAAVWCPAESKYIAYNTSQGTVAGKINVHLVAHTHDDVGWLKTVDQYYVGSNNSIQGACVQNVLDSMVTALLADKNRKFIYVEQAFFQRWWRRQSDSIKNIVKQFVSSGQLEFINGGMCMHDEATTHYIDMIDQTTLGHRFIKQEFDQTPRIGWQIDPFGHSAVQAYLLGAEVLPLGAQLDGKLVHNFVIEHRVDSCISIDTSLVDKYSKCGNLKAAQRCFRSMPKRDVVSWTVIVGGYNNHGMGEVALTKYSYFHRTKMEPNAVMLVSLLSTCNHSGLVAQGMGVFKSMEDDFRIVPRIEYCASSIYFTELGG